MKVSEKSLELNIGAEILNLMRNSWGMPKAYLRGLTQAEERQEGVDFFVQLNPNTRICAFQFKAPHGKTESSLYKYTLVRYQHNPLFELSQLSPGGVFYVLPYYVTFRKLQNYVPNLMLDTWFLNVSPMQPPQVFGKHNSRTIRVLEAPSCSQSRVRPGETARYEVQPRGSFTSAGICGLVWGVQES